MVLSGRGGELAGDPLEIALFRLEGIRRVDQIAQLEDQIGFLLLEAAGGLGELCRRLPVIAGACGGTVGIVQVGHQADPHLRLCVRVGRGREARNSLRKGSRPRQQQRSVPNKRAAA